MSVFPALRHRNYQLFFGGQALSLIGSWMQIAAQGWLVTLLASGETDANRWQSLTTTLGSLPMFFGALVGGLVADRFSKRSVILLMQTIQGVLAAGMAALILSGQVRMWHLGVFALLVGITNVFDIPARQAFVVEMVGKHDLANAIGLNSSLFNAARVFGPAISAALIARLGAGGNELVAIGQCFLANGVSYVAVLVGLLAMRGDFRAEASGKEPPLVQLREAAGFLRRRRGILALMALVGAGSIFMTADFALLPSLARYTLHADARGYGLLMALRGVGALAAALLMATLPSWVRRGPLVLSAAIAWPAFSIATALSGSLAHACLFVPLAGFSMICCFVTANTLMQMSSPDALRGRVMGVHAFLMMGLTPVGGAWAGLVARYADTPHTIALGGALTLLCALAIAAAFPELRRAQERLTGE